MTEARREPRRGFVSDRRQSDDRGVAARERYERLRAGDASAWNEFARSTVIRLVPRSRPGSGVSREDVLIDTLSEIWESIQRLDSPEKLSRFARTIARRVAARHAALVRAQHELLLAAVASQPSRAIDIDDGDASSVDGIAGDELAARCLAALEESDRCLFRMLYVAMLADDEICRRLAIAAGTLRMRKCRLRRRLRQQIGEP